MADSAWREEVLDFWFRELTPEDWYSGRSELDERIRERFSLLHAAVAQTSPADLAADPRSALAEVIVLDQFSRNMFRGTRAAFANDARALEIARSIVDRGLDAGLNDREKQFLYMPFMHSESLQDQNRSIELFSGLGEENMKYALDHRDIIARFGRFPHRNQMLGRQSTVAETEFMKENHGF